MAIYAALTDQDVASVLADHGGKGFGDFKKALSEAAVTKLGPIGAEMQRLLADPGYVDGVLKNGGEKARAIAAPILDEVYRHNCDSI